MAGKIEARDGLCRALAMKTGKAALSEYRKVLFLMGSTTSREGQKAMDREAVRKVVEADGTLPLAQVLRLRVRYFYRWNGSGLKRLRERDIRNASRTIWKT